jgi:protein ImuA
MRLHEVAAGSPDLADDASATLFLAALAARQSRAQARHRAVGAARRDLFAPGLANAGLTADRLS